MNWRSIAVRCAGLVTPLTFLVATAHAAIDKPAVVGNLAILLQPNETAGSARVDVRNDGADVMTLHLSLAAPSDEAQGATVAIKEQPDTASTLNLSLKPHETQRVSIVASSVGADDFDIDLLNGAERIAKIGVKHIGFSVHLADPKTAVNLYERATSDLKVTNDDRWPHDVAWRLRFDGRDLCSGRVSIAAKHSALLPCTPAFGWPALSWMSTVFRPQSGSDAMLVMDRADGPPGQPPLTIAAVPLSAQYFATASQQAINYVAILVVLVLGGVASLLLSQIIPNRLKRIELHGGLDDLNRSIGGLGSHVDSNLRVSLRVERRRLVDVLGSRAAFSPEFATVAAQCSQGIDRLAKRVALAQQLDVALKRMLDRETASSIAPTQAKNARTSLKRAQDILRNSTPADADLVAAAQAIVSAVQIIDGAAQPDAALVQAVAATLASLKKEVGPLKNDAEFQRVTTAVPQPLGSVENAPDPIPETAAPSLDSAAAKLRLICDYVRHRNGTTTPDKRQRMDEAEKTLLPLLENSNIASINEAETKLQQIRDDIYPYSLIKPLRDDQARIVVNPSLVYDRIPVQFSVRFNEAAIDRAAAARQEFRCEWDFGEDFREDGWEVSHYYIRSRENEGKFTARATFINEKGEAVIGNDGNPVVLKADIVVRSPSNRSLFGERSMVELFKLGAALLIAVFALASGARDQIAKLDLLPGLIAVFMIGFTADTIKSLLSGKS
jgi:hypothetical protein